MFYLESCWFSEDEVWAKLRTCGTSVEGSIDLADANDVAHRWLLLRPDLEYHFLAPIDSQAQLADWTIENLSVLYEEVDIDEIVNTLASEQWEDLTSATTYEDRMGS